MKRVIASSYEYRRHTIYDNDGKWYIFTQPNGKGYKEFDTPEDAEEYIDSMIANSSSEQSSPSSNIQKEDTTKYVVARIRRDKQDLTVNYEWLSTNNRYISYNRRGKELAAKMSKANALEKVKQGNSKNDMYVYKHFTA